MHSAIIIAIIPITAIMLNCTVKLEIVFRTMLRIGAIAVPKNKTNVFTDKKNPWLPRTVKPTLEIVDGIAKAIPLTSDTLQIISNTMFVVTDIKISATVLTTNALKIRFLTPMRSLIRPAISDNNIPIIPNSLALIAVVSSPPMVSEVT